eukprot:4648234-Amphidinium_carterae.1
MELLEPSLIGLMKYVQSMAKGLTASTLLEECVAGLEISKDHANPPPALLPLGSEEPQEQPGQESDEDMVGDPQVTLDLYTIRAWQRALQVGQQWPPAATQWANAAKGRRGRGP